jgi:FKBP-type peptidyl-prolyl cis-trans isomerase 2
MRIKRTDIPVLGLAALLALAPVAGCSSDASSADSSSSDAAAQTSESAASTEESGKNTGKKVSVNYIGTLEDGTEFDNSYTRGTPLEFTVGSGQMISGFDAAVADMEVGETKTVTLTPDEAYGEYNENLVITYPKDDVADFDQLSVGDTVYLSTTSGSTVAAKVTEKTDDSVTVDANSELAGKTLVFQIELLGVEDE